MVGSHHREKRLVNGTKKKKMETGSILPRKGAGRPSTSGEDVEHVRELFNHSPRKSIWIRMMMLTNLDNKTLRNVLSQAVNSIMYTISFLFIYYGFNFGTVICGHHVYSFIAKWVPGNIVSKLPAGVPGVV